MYSNQSWEIFSEKIRMVFGEFNPQLLRFLKFLESSKEYTQKDMKQFFEDFTKSFDCICRE